MNDTPDIMLLDELADYLRLSKSYIRSLTRDDMIPYIKFPVRSKGSKGQKVPVRYILKDVLEALQSEQYKKFLSHQINKSNPSLVGNSYAEKMGWGEWIK